MNTSIKLPPKAIKAMRAEYFSLALKAAKKQSELDAIKAQMDGLVSVLGEVPTMNQKDQNHE